MPVPDCHGSVASFLDIGLESFQSLYEDLGELITTSSSAATTVAVTSTDQPSNLVTR